MNKRERRSSDSLLKLKDLSKTYRNITLDGFIPRHKQVRALVSVSGSFEGGILGLVGPNGAGKTTLIKIIAGLLHQSSGNLEVLGYDPWSESTTMKVEMGFLLEEPQYPPLSGRKYLKYICEIRGFDGSSAEKETESLLDRVRLSAAQNRKISTYSAGMRRRLGLAVALVGLPRFVVLDEPTKSLDPDGRRLFMETVNQYYKEHNTSFLISSHILADLERICTNAWIISKGEIIAAGPMAEIAEIKRPTRFLVEVDKPEVLYDYLQMNGSPKEVTRDGHRLYVRGEEKTLFDLISRGVHHHGLTMQRFQPAKGELERIMFGEDDGDD
ncbi:MAG: ABC transporter ATP-binding protein [Candidatus Thorarchaeota archaeon]